jgi:hypothetical protein
MGIAPRGGRARYHDPMLWILRQLTGEELRRAAVHAHALPGAGPEEIIRSLSRVCGATVWGFFPAATDDALLTHVSQRLGLGIPPGPQHLAARERAILAHYFRHAWHTADPERRWTILRAALEGWDTRVVSPPRLPPDPFDEGACLAAVETLLQHPAGVRALARATESAALPLPGTDASFGPFVLRMLGVADGHQCLYAVLRVLWRARSRLLRERHALHSHLTRELGQLTSLLEARQRNLQEAGPHWGANPASGLWVFAGAGASFAVHAALGALAPVTVFPAAVVGAAGLAWAALADGRAAGPKGGRLAQMQAQAASLRQQIAGVTREIGRLETE